MRFDPLIGRRGRDFTHGLMYELSLSAHRSQGEKEMQGIIVAYKVKVNLMVSSGG